MSAAHFLKGRYEVIIFEKEGTPGGLIKCCRVNGNLFHTCGGHVFNSKRQDVCLTGFGASLYVKKNFQRLIVILLSYWKVERRFLILLRITCTFLMMIYRKSL